MDAGMYARKTKRHLDAQARKLKRHVGTFALKIQRHKGTWARKTQRHASMQARGYVKDKDTRACDLANLNGCIRKTCGNEFIWIWQELFFF